LKVCGPPIGHSGGAVFRSYGEGEGEVGEGNASQAAFLQVLSSIKENLRKRQKGGFVRARILGQQCPPIKEKVDCGGDGGRPL